MVISILFCQIHVIKGILTHEGRISKVYKRALTSVASDGQCWKDQILKLKRSGDRLPELPTADADEIKAWKKEKHLGSPTSILFFTQDQLRLWDEERMIFMADYSTGWRSLLIFQIEYFA